MTQITIDPGAPWHRTPPSLWTIEQRGLFVLDIAPAVLFLAAFVVWYVSGDPGLATHRLRMRGGAIVLGVIGGAVAYLRWFS